jgi:hypothetical protein
MTGTVSPQVPILNSPDSTEEPKVRSAIITLRDALNGVLTSANILDGAKLAAGTVATASLANLSVTAAKIGLGQVNVLHIAADAVTNAAMANNSVDSAEIVNGAVGAAKLNLPNDSDALATTITPLSSSMTDVCSVSVAVGGTYFVTAQTQLDAVTTNQSCNAHVSLNYNGSEHESNDVLFTDVAFPSFNQVVTISSGTTLKLRAKSVGVNDIRVRGADSATATTRLTVIRFNA